MRFPLLRAALCLVALQLVVGFASPASSQTLSNYTATRSTEIDYTSIGTTGYAVPSWRNTSEWVQDDNRSFPVPIGFDFWYNGTRYTTLCVSTNGFVDFSNSISDGTVGLLNDGTGYGYMVGRDYDSQIYRIWSTAHFYTWNALAPFYCDLTTQNQIDPLGTSVKYLTTGVAPNRVFTVEWINMSQWNYAGRGTSLNFQIKLYESTGRFEYVYGNMLADTLGSGSHIPYSAACGFNAATVVGDINTLRIQQAVDGTTFTQAGTTLNGVPTSYTRVEITPNLPADPTALALTAVLQSSVRLKWTDNATNEIGYAIYYSSDGSSYTFLRQDPAHAGTGSDSADVTGLSPGSLYYFRVYALTEGAQSNPLDGSVTTLPAGEIVSAQNGLWSQTTTWVGGIVPTVSSNVLINDGHTVTIDANFRVNSIHVGTGVSGILRIGNNATPRIDTVLTNIAVSAGATLDVGVASTTLGHTLVVGGNIQNDGTLNLATSASSKCRVLFNRAGTQTISGSGATTRFYRMTVDLGSVQGNLLDIYSSVFTPDTSNFLTIASGTVRFSTSGTFTPFAGNAVIPLFAGLWINNPAATVTVTDSLTVSGLLRLTAGTLNIGTAANNRLVSWGGNFIVEGGSMNIAGSFGGKDSTTVTNFSMSGGTFTVPTVGMTWDATKYSPFTMNVPGSVFTMSGGAIIIQQEGGPSIPGYGYFNTGSTTASVTGGRIQIGNASTPGGHTMRIASVAPVYDLLITAPGNGILDGNLTVLNNTTIGDTLYGSSRTLTLYGNWIDNRRFVPGTSTIAFSGSGLQTISRIGGESFKNVSVIGTGTVSRTASVTVDSLFTLTSGTFDVGTDSLTLNGTASGNGTLLASSGTVRYLQGVAGQPVLAASYRNLIFNAFAKTLPSGGTVGIGGLFTAGGSLAHVVTGSTVDFNGTSSQSIPRFDFNNLRISGSAAKIIAATDSVRGDLTIAGGATLQTDSTLLVKGNVTHNGTHTGASPISLVGGSAAHLITASSAFGEIALNDAAGAQNSGTVSVHDSLTLANGAWTTGTDTLRILPTCGVVRTNGRVNGWLQKSVGTGARSVLFEVGDATNYAPAQFWFANVSSAGTIACRDSAGDNPNILSAPLDATNSVNRSWQMLTGGGFAYAPSGNDSVRFTYVPADQDVPASWPVYRIAVFNGTTWDSTVAGWRGTTSTTGRGFSSVGSFQVGSILSNGAYRSKQTGDWSLASTWERLTSGSWAAAATAPTITDGTVTIRTGHTVTISASTSITHTIVQAGAVLTVTGAATTLTISDSPGSDLIVQGTVRNASGNNFTINASAAIAMGPGGRFEHARHGGNIPTATWDPASTCAIIGGAAAGATIPGNFSQAFGNVEWNYATQNATIGLANTPATITGSFNVLGTNGAELDLQSANGQTRTIGGSLNIQNGLVVGYPTGGGAMTGTMNIAKSLVIGGGTFRPADAANKTLTLNVTDSLKLSGGSLVLATASGAVGTINVQKDVLHSGTTISNGGGTATINFTGTLPRSYTGGGAVANAVNWAVAANVPLTIRTDTLKGTGTFTIAAGATLTLGSPAGITSSGANGNIQVGGTRTFAITANYAFAGSVAQVTGNGLPATVKQLTVNNPAGVSLSGNVTLTDSLKLLSGIFDIGTNTLILPSAVVLGGGSLTSAATGRVSYTGAAAGQRVIPMQYGHLTFNNTAKVMSAGDSIKIAGVFTPGTSKAHSVTGTTFDFDGVNQIIPSFRFHNLRISGSGTKTLGAVDTAMNSLEIASGIFRDSSFTFVVRGSVRNYGSHTGNGRIRVSSTSSAPTISGGGTFTNVEVDNISYGATISGSMAVLGQLILTNGVIATGTDSVLLTGAGFVTRPVGGGWINGFLRKPVPVKASPQTVTLQVGDAVRYTPVDLTFASVGTAGTITGSTTGVEYPAVQSSGINPSKSINRFWTLRNSGVVYSTVDGTFTFDPTDIDAGANTSAFVVRVNLFGQWYATTNVVRTATSTKGVGMPGFGANAVGELHTTAYWTGAAGTRSWKTARNWSILSVPTIANTVRLDGGAPVDVDTAARTNKVYMLNDTLALTVLPGMTLKTADSLWLSKGSLRINATKFDSVTTMVIDGGNVTYGASANQIIKPYTYRTLVLSGSATKAAGGAFGVTDTLRILSGVTLFDSTFAVSLSRDVVNGGTHTSGTGRLLLTGGIVAHRVSGGGPFGNVELNDGLGTTVVGPKTVFNGTITLTTGTMTLNGTDTLSISGTGNVVRTGGLVAGTIQRSVPTGSSSLVYPIGAGGAYVPVRLQFSSVTTPGTVTLVRTSGDHPNGADASAKIDTTADINAWWRLTNSGVVLGGPYTATFGFRNPAEVNGGVNPLAADFSSATWNGSAWTLQAVGLKTADSTRVDGMLSFGDFSLGKLLSSLIAAIQSGLWNNPSTWGSGRIPGANDSVVINAPMTITLNTNPAVAKLTVNGGGFLNDSTFTISVSGGLILNGTVTGLGKVALTSSRDSIYGNGSVSGTSTLEIAASKAVARSANLFVPTMTILASDTLKNLGTMSVISVGGPGVWVNASNSTLNVLGAGFGAGTLNASACPNVVSFTGTGVQTVAPTTYCDLILANSGQKTLPGDALVQTTLSIASGSNLTINPGVTLQVLGPVSVAGTVTNNGKLKISD